MSKGRSADGAAMMRAMEAFVPAQQRLFDDPFAVQLLPAMGRLWIQNAWLRRAVASMIDRKTPGIRGSILCRTRWIDDGVQDAFRRGIRTFVILGAGSDSRGYRIPELKKGKIFEVDLPSVQAVKRKRLAKAAVDTSHVRFISTDFDAVPLEQTLREGQVPQGEPICFVWEGVTQYLSSRGVCQVLDHVAAGAPGSEIIFTYVVEEVITKRYSLERNDPFRKAASYQPEPWHFGIDPVGIASFLSEHRLVLVSDAGAERYLVDYLRPRGRELKVAEIERVARAAV